MRSAKTFRLATWPKRPKQTTSLGYAWVIPLPKGGKQRSQPRKVVPRRIRGCWSNP
jgi:hypothetical protein